MMFTSKPDHATRNLEHSRTITASPARLSTGENEFAPGVAIFTRGMVASVVTTEAAHRLALEIIAALEEHKQEKPVKRSDTVNAAFADLADR